MVTFCTVAGTGTVASNLALVARKAGPPRAPPPRRRSAARQPDPSKSSGFPAAKIRYFRGPAYSPACAKGRERGDLGRFTVVRGNLFFNDRPCVPLRPPPVYAPELPDGII